jgi:hypothetical protein
MIITCWNNQGLNKILIIKEYCKSWMKGKINLKLSIKDNSKN